MLVFEYRLHFRLLKPVAYTKAAEVVSYFIDSAFAQDEEFLRFHEKNEYKYYSFDLFYPCEESGHYQAGKIYSVRIRTVRQELAEYFSQTLPCHRSEEMLGLNGELKIIPKKMIERIYSLTPVIIKTEEGYWRQHMSLPEFENRIKVNLIKKYNQLTNSKIDEDFELYNLIVFKNTKPVKVPYKGIHLLGDKVNLTASNHPAAQELLYMSLGTGLGENNSRGAGFVNYRFL